MEWENWWILVLSGLAVLKKINNISNCVLLISLRYRYEVQGLALLSTYSIYELCSPSFTTLFI